jgi:hypothetical protein
MNKNDKINWLREKLNPLELRVFNALSKKSLYRMLDVDLDLDSLLITLKNVINSGSIEVKRDQLQRQRQDRFSRQRQDQPQPVEPVIESVEPIEIPIPRLGIVEIDSETFKFFCSIFNFSPTEGKKRIYNLYVYHPARCPLVGLGIHIPDPKELFYHALAEYSIGKGEGYQAFTGCFSKEVFSFLKSVGNKTVRKKAWRDLSGPCVTYKDGKITGFIFPRDRIYDHVAPKMISWDPLQRPL